MAKSIYVGNLSFNTTEQEVRKAFASYGEVLSVKIISDRETGRSRGFGFVEMEDASAREAISALNGTNLEGRPLTVKEAEPRKERSPRW